ncbi:hypothetical protein EB796_019748 [Bugula neritina]|nr:hypothetical protein EB796_019748 [Bugula neritina]
MNHIHTSELLHLRDALLDNHHSLSQGKKVELVRTRSNSPKLKQGVKACEETWSYFRLQSDKSPDSEVKCQRSEERPHLHSHKQFSRPIAGDRHPPRRRMMCQPTEHSDYSLVDKVL